MKAVDLQNEYAEYLCDEKLKISDRQLNKICRLRQGSKTCKYICLTLTGYKCIKNTPLKKIIDDLSQKKVIKVKGDNCAGL